MQKIRDKVKGKKRAEKRNTFSLQTQALGPCEKLNDVREGDENKTDEEWITEGKDEPEREQKKGAPVWDWNLRVEHPCTFISTYYV